MNNSQYRWMILGRVVRVGDNRVMFRRVNGDVLPFAEGVHAEVSPVLRSAVMDGRQPQIVELPPLPGPDVREAVDAWRRGEA